MKSTQKLKSFEIFPSKYMYTNFFASWIKKRLFFRILIVANVLFLSAGCTESIDGTISINHPGQPEQRQKNVMVQVVPLKQFKEFFKGKAVLHEAELISLEKQITHFKDSIQSMEKRKKSNEELLFRGAVMASTAPEIYGPSWQAQMRYKESVNALRDASDSLAAVMADSQKTLNGEKEDLKILEEKADRFREYRETEFYYSGNFPGAIAQTRTDDRGQFSLKYESKEPVIIVAGNLRFQWFVFIDSGDTDLLLGTENMGVNVRCERCVFIGDTKHLRQDYKNKASIFQKIRSKLI